MIRLNSIKIKGFKDPSYEKELTFSSEPITVIYGENGSGKTTLLKVLFAVLNRDEETLLRENVIEIETQYTKNGENKILSINRDEEGSINWSDNLDLYNTTSILFGVHRGLVQDRNNTLQIDRRRLILIIERLYEVLENPKYGIRNPNKLIFDLKATFASKIRNFSRVDVKEILFIINNMLNIFGHTRNIEFYRQVNLIKKEIEYRATRKIYENNDNDFLKKINTQAHLSTNFVQIKDIQNAIISQFNKGQNIASEKIKNAFFETIEKAVEIDETNKDFTLPENFEVRIKKNKNFILEAITKKKSPLTKRIKKYVKTGDKTLTENSKIFRAMLLNIVESAEESNPILESVTKLKEVFNEHLYDGKKLIIKDEKAYILLKNGNSHGLNNLSSGERNLLSILTLFLIIGRERNFLMIDEPEISFNIKWQRDFLPLLSRLNSQAQIIVASHSPSIAHNNSNYLVKLI